MYMTLEEAADWLTRALDSSEMPVTANQLLRAGIGGVLRICAPLDGRFYSPTRRMASDRALREAGITTKDLLADSVERGTVDALGLFAVPPRHLFTLESEEIVRLKMVSSLDGAELYFPHVTLRRDQLRVLTSDLKAFALRVEPRGGESIGSSEKSGSEGGPSARRLSEKDEHEVRAALAAGESVSAIARKFGVSRKVIDQYRPGGKRSGAGKQASPWDALTKRNKA